MAINNRSITSAESEQFLIDFLKKYEYLGPKMENHKKVRRVEDTYTLTVDRISTKFLDDLLNNSKVLDVYYNAVHPPQGMTYGINMRYRLYVKYKKIPL